MPSASHHQEIPHRRFGRYDDLISIIGLGGYHFRMVETVKEAVRRLHTDYLDLWQIHECAYESDPERHFAKGGVNGFDANFRSFKEIVRGSSAMSAREQHLYETGLRDDVMDGRFELYKTTAEHEGDVGREQHGFPLQDEVAQ